MPFLNKTLKNLTAICFVALLCPKSIQSKSITILLVYIIFECCQGTLKGVNAINAASKPTAPDVTYNISNKDLDLQSQLELL
jgi:hypothetical protein